MNRLVVSRQAQLDLRDIADYIARDNPDRAETFVEELLEVMETVRVRPASFRFRDEWHSELRSANHQGYQIIFKDREAVVEILRIIHGARDIPNIL